jgi:hypothetical protein
MKSEDEEFELFLRQFRPRRPRPLPSSAAGRRRPWAQAIAAGLVAAAVVAWAVSRPPRPAQTTSTRPAPASPVVNWNVDALDRMLIGMSPRVLPDVERPDRTLHVLAAP